MRLSTMKRDRQMPQKRRTSFRVFERDRREILIEVDTWHCDDAFFSLRFSMGGV